MPNEALDDAVTDLARSKHAWAILPLERKILYAEGLLSGVQRVAEGQVRAAAEAKGIDPDSPLAGEEWLGGPYVSTRTLRLLIRTLKDLGRFEAVCIGSEAVRVHSNGQVAVEVFPLSVFDRLLYSGFSAEVWMEPGLHREDLALHTAGLYRRTEGSEPPASVALVLGAGNVAAIGFLDVVHKLFAEGQVVVLKLNPVNDYLGPFFEDAFGELIRDGYVRIVYGGAEVGRALVEHPKVDEIHVTGAASTHDAIVFGPGEEGARRKLRNEPRLEKRITSELGNVSPVVLVPGNWSRSDLRFHAESVATQMVQNGGFNCNAAKVLVTHREWPQRAAFLDDLRAVLRRLPRRPAYYPRAEERYRRFVTAYPQTEMIGRRDGGSLPPALAAGLDAETCDPLAFTTESFCSFTAEVPLDGDGPADFLARAVDFANNRLYGTLNASLVVHPATARRLSDDLEKAIEELRYGTVALNQWPALGFGLGSTPWGAFPGHTPDDIQSGTGTVHNTFLFDRPQKSVIRAPFRVIPKPPWFVTHGNAHRVGELLSRFEAAPSAAKLPGIFWAALRG